MIDREDPRLTAYLLNELDEDNRLEIEAALENSVELRGVVDELRDTIQLLTTEFKRELRDEPVFLTQESTAQADTGIMLRKSNFIRSNSPHWILVGSIVLLLCSAGYWLYLGQGPVRPVATVDEHNQDLTESVDIGMMGRDSLEFDQSSSKYRNELRRSDSLERAASGRDKAPSEGGGGSQVSEGLLADHPQMVEQFKADAHLDVELEQAISGDESIEIAEDMLPILNDRRETAAGEIGRGFFGGERDGIGGGGFGGFQGRDTDRANVAADDSGERMQGRYSNPIDQGGQGQDRLRSLSGSEGRMRAERRAETRNDASWRGAAGDSGGDSASAVDTNAELREEAEKTTLGQRLREPAPALAGSNDSISPEPKNAAPGASSQDDEQNIAKKSAEVSRNWRRVSASPNTSRLMVGDNDELRLSGSEIRVHIDGFRARVILDSFYYNDRDQSLEGIFKLRLPDDASLFYFAFGESAYEVSKDFSSAQNGMIDEKQLISALQSEHAAVKFDEIGNARRESWQNVKEARMVTREKAAFAYTETTRRRVDPALAEWAGAGIFQTRVFPLTAKRLHRIVIGYDVNLIRSNDGLSYILDLPQDTGYCRVQLSIDQVADEQIATIPAQQPVTRNGRHEFVWVNPEHSFLEVVRSNQHGIILTSKQEDEIGYFAAQVAVDLPMNDAVAAGNVLFLVDTSLSSNPDKFNVWLKILEQTLTLNRDSIQHFAVLFFSVDNWYWKPEYTPNTAENVEQLLADCQTLVLEGATNLFAAARRVQETEWLSQGSTSPDLFLLSDGNANWGETNLWLIQAEFAKLKPRGMFAYQTGMDGTAVDSLRFLTSSFGGAVFGVSNESEVSRAATAHRMRPWLLKELEVDGATDILTAGRVAWIYPGQSLTLAGRGSVAGNLRMIVEQDGVEQSFTVDFGSPVESQLASRLYGQIAVGQLEALGSISEEVSAAFARHFRIPGETCSLVMLESDADYERFNIRPEEDQFVVRAKPADDFVVQASAEAHVRLSDPKKRLLHWLERLESIDGLQFKIPTALALVLERIEVDAINAELNIAIRQRSELPEKYLNDLLSPELDYDVMMNESKRRADESSDEAIKVLSNLIERNAGDFVMARDVAWSVMQLGRPEHAYGLLHRVALARPFEGSIYLATGDCLAQAGQADLATVYYEVALHAQFEHVGPDFRTIVAMNYLRLLRQMIDGKVPTKLADYAAARWQTLQQMHDIGKTDLVVILAWNTDRTDVDLQVTEPNGEVCSYQNKTTRSGGRITHDITSGYGPEMYWHQEAPQGEYEVVAHYYSGDQSRTKMRSRVQVTVIRLPNTEHEVVDRKIVLLNETNDVHQVLKFTVEK
ncbi:MAG TPA: hypothetical protein PKD64_17760 [Pirellulaceae bacterium]|nr:hypothetical protein [Pirellulaceae bacterium]HMO94035.1 hypothetical protein [Pirellulaceae bacterium]HMP70905.1 hypothetical protein [Pirellulaceae bacterium]